MSSRATQLPRRLPRRLIDLAVVGSRHRLRRLAPARDLRGSAGVETLIMASAALSIVLVVVAAGRYVDGSAQANDAAYVAARAASLESGMGQGAIAGRQAAEKSLAERGKSCQNLTVSFAGSDFTPGGQVVAEVTCTVTLIDTGTLGKQLGLRPNTQFTERAVVPIETYRSAS